MGTNVLSITRQLNVSRVSVALVLFVCFSIAGESASATVDIVSVDVQNLQSGNQVNVPVTFAQVFAKGEIVNSSTLGAKLADGSVLELQVDAKATHDDGSLRHAVLTTFIPNLQGNDTAEVTLFAPGTNESGSAVSLDELLATQFDATVELDLSGDLYIASARDLLTNGNPIAWLSGPLVTEWLVSGPLRAAAGSQHPHLTARFHVRWYRGAESARVSVTVENSRSLVAAPRNYDYDVRVNVDGKGIALDQAAVSHFRQARWRRLFWWGNDPSVEVLHDTDYLAQVGVVPTYDSRLRVPGSVLSGLDSTWQGRRTELMEEGTIATYMPAGGGRDDIAPLPRWTALYLVTQDRRAKRVTLGNSEQAGSFGIHYRDSTTDLPISLDTYPNMTVLGERGIFPACGGDCDTPYVADVAHQPSLSFVPYLVTGDYFHLEELFFWANWNLFYWGNHGGSLGLLAFDQVRAQAWGLRTLGHAAYIAPDAHPLKAYFQSKLTNNLDWYVDALVDNAPTPLGYMLNPPGLGVDQAFATWMDDFFTWTVGHLANLGFDDAAEIFQYKAQFPVGRMINPDYCWILASTYWTRARDATSGDPYFTWSDYKESVVRSWDSDTAGPSFAGTAPGMSGDKEDALIAAACDSVEMANILGLRRGNMIGYAFSHEGYPANLQPALAIAVEREISNASAAWNTFDNRSVKPDSGEYDYDISPQWAIVPGSLRSGPGAPGVLPSATLSAEPTIVNPGEQSTITWVSTNADSCIASGAWSGDRPLSGSETVGPLDATSTFDLQCNNTAGSSLASVTVVVAAASAPALTLSASSTSVVVGSSVTLTWASQNTDSCSASGGWSGSKPLEGEETVGPLSATTEFILDCSAGSSSVSQSVNVTVTSAPADPPVAPVSRGGSGVTGTAFLVLLSGMAGIHYSRRARRRCL